MALVLLISFSCEKELVEVPISSLQFVTPTNVIEAGSTDTLELKIYPQDATDKVLTWKSSDPSVAEVDANGAVRAISPGTALVSVTSGDSEFSATTTVHVIRWTYYYMKNVHVRPIIVDSQDNVWCGGTELTRFMHNNKLVCPAITNISAIAGNNEKSIWLGTYHTGIWKFDGTNWTNYTSSNSNIVYNSIHYNSMTLDLDGNLWFGTSTEEGKGSGVTMFDGSQAYVFNSEDGLASNIVSDIAVDNEGVKWFVTTNGVSTFDGSNWFSYTSENTGINSIGQFLSVTIDKENNKWFCNYYGAFKFDGTNWTVYDTSNSGLTWRAINDIAVDQDNNIWFGTENGVSKFDGTNWINYASVKEGIYNVSNVRAITIDSKGDKWLGTSDGAIKLED